MSKKSLPGMYKLLLAGGVLVLIIVTANYMSARNNNPFSNIDQAIRTGKAKAYGVNECVTPVVPGTNMSDAALRDYFAYHINETNFGNAWYTCSIFPLMQNMMAFQSATVLAEWVNVMETQGPCDVPAESDVDEIEVDPLHNNGPGMYCGKILAQ